MLLQTPFENVNGIKGYYAIFSYQDKFIEAELDTIGLHALPAEMIIGRLLPHIGRPYTENLTDQRVVFTSEEERYSNIKISIGFSTDLFALININQTLKRFPKVQRDRYLEDPLIRKPITLLIEGVPLLNYDQVVNTLEKIKDSILFQIDPSISASLDLRSEERFGRSHLRSSIANTALYFPKFQYDKIPMSLYWYATQAEGIPLLQYLAYYQTIEYYFPIFAKSEAHDIVKRMVKDPSFGAALDENVSRLLATIQPLIGKGGYGGDESKSLLTTVRYSVTNEELREFFNGNEERFNFFKTDSHAIVPKKISVESSKADLVTETAQRIYDIRCRIVHTKSSEVGDQIDLLLPQSREARKLSNDIELIRFIARKVLVAASQPLQL